MLGEAEGTVGDAVYNVQWDPMDMLTIEQDEVVLEDQQRVVRDEDEALFFIVPVIHPGTTRERVCKHNINKHQVTSLLVTSD